MTVLRSKAYPVRISRDWWVYAEDWPTQEISEDAALVASYALDRPDSSEVERIADMIARRARLGQTPYGCNLLLIPEIGLNGLALEHGRSRRLRRAAA